MVDRARLLVAFRFQAGGCDLFGSPFYAELMRAAHDDVAEGGLVAQILDDWQGDPVRGFLPLRLFGAVHGRVLAGEAPELAACYPTAGGHADAAAAWPAFLAVLERDADRIRPRLERFPQTNEVRRCAGLLGGFLEIAAETGLPLRLREIGCSAGLNLQWSRYHYRLEPHRWGSPDSPVAIEAEWSGGRAKFDSPVEIESRAGCDLAPRDIGDTGAVRELESFVWADQPERLEQLRAAVEITRADPPRVDESRAMHWLPAELDADSRGLCRVVFHSSVWLYLPPEEQASVRGQLADRGAIATRQTPLAWLRHEDGKVPGSMEIRLTLWPGGEDRLLGMGHPHGRFVQWHGA
jgi:hypothetical protein